MSKLKHQLVEYIGTYPGCSVHGNAKQTTQDYVRTTQNKKKVIREHLEHNIKPIEIMNKINENDKENPICRKVIENAKYNLKKKERPDRYAQNMADELQIILNNLQSNSFTRSVVANSNGKPPGIICFTDEQIGLMKSAVHSGNVIGIDRTFNLGACFVTTMVFQNNNVVRKGTNTSPITLGPTYLHWDGSYFSETASNVIFRNNQPVE